MVYFHSAVPEQILLSNWECFSFVVIMNNGQCLELQCEWIKSDLAFLHEIIRSERKLSMFYHCWFLQGSKKLRVRI